MNSILENISQNTVIVGDRNKIREQLMSRYAGEVFYEVNAFEISVEEVRLARKWLVNTGEGATLILSSFYWNEEVQNALLKVLEDTPSDSKIILIGHEKSFFLSTILSRVFCIELVFENVYKKLAEELLSQPKHLRLQNTKLKKLLAQTVEDVDSDRKDKEAQILLFNALMKVVLIAWKENRNAYSKLQIERLKTLSNNIYNYGGNPSLSIEWLLLNV